MHDAGYKRLFAQPHTVQDLLRGFAARDWSEALDFSTLTPVPASFVSHRLRQRHGDLVWRVRFHDEWLYLLVLLEFQSTIEPAMATRMLTYTGMLYEKLIDDGVLREHGKLPYREWVNQVLVPRKMKGHGVGIVAGIGGGRADVAGVGSRMGRGRPRTGYRAGP